MTSPNPQKITVKVEVTIETNEGTVVVKTPTPEIPSLKKSRGPITIQLIASPTGSPTDSSVSLVNNMLCLDGANGTLELVNGHTPQKAYAICYPTPNQAIGGSPPGGAKPVTITGQNWSVTQVPTAKCDGIKNGPNNSLFAIWYEYTAEDTTVSYFSEKLPFHGYCPNSSSISGSTMPLIVIHQPPDTILLSFTGSCAGLGAVQLTNNGVSWVGQSPALGGIQFRYTRSHSTFELQATGSEVNFIVAGPASCAKPFIWSAQGNSLGKGAGAFTVTATE